MQSSTAQLFLASIRATSDWLQVARKRVDSREVKGDFLDDSLTILGRVMAE